MRRQNSTSLKWSVIEQVQFVLIIILIIVCGGIGCVIADYIRTIEMKKKESCGEIFEKAHE